MKGSAKSPQVVEAMRVAVQQVEESSGVAADDPAILGLKLNVVRTAGELEVAKARRQDQDVEPPSTSMLDMPSA
jgi:hypothetical protein